MDIISDAKSYISSKFVGVPTDDFDDDTVITLIDQLYPGGWADYQLDFRRFEATVVTPEARPSMLKLWSQFQQLAGGSVQRYRRGVHDEVLSVDLTTMEAMIQVHKVDHRSTRDIITQVGLKLLTAKDAVTVWADESPTEEIVWALKCGDTDRATLLARLSVLADKLPKATTHVRWGRVATPDWVATQREQFETCYRPGGEKTPMQGWVARLELSHEQAHKGEAFQKPVKVVKIQKGA